MKTLLHLMIITALFSSCKKYNSAEVDQTKIKQVYQVQYYKESNVTEITASFHYANGWGNSIVLSGNAAIRYANTPLQYNNISRNYKLYINGQHLQSNFTFTDNNSIVYTNTSSYVTPIQLNIFNSIYIDKKVDFNFGLGNVVGNNYNNNVKLNFANKIFYANKFGNSYTFNITANEFNDVTAGYYIGTISNSLKTELTQSNGAGGSVSTEYFSYAFSIQVY